jgi:hypothetical protein
MREKKCTQNFKRKTRKVESFESPGHKWEAEWVAEAWLYILQKRTLTCESNQNTSSAQPIAQSLYRLHNLYHRTPLKCKHTLVFVTISVVIAINEHLNLKHPAILCRNRVGMGVCTRACAQQINHLSTYA